MALSLSPRQAQFIGRLIRRGRAAAAAAENAAKTGGSVRPAGWGKGPIKAELEYIKKGNLLRRDQHKFGMMDALGNKVGWAMIKKRRGNAYVDRVHHYDDIIGTTSNPIGPKDILAMKRKFTKDNPDVHTFSFERVYAEGTHDKFKTVPIFRWRGMRYRRQTVPVKGREHLAEAERKFVIKRNVGIGAGVAATAAAGGAAQELYSRSRRKRA